MEDRYFPRTQVGLTEQRDLPLQASLLCTSLGHLPHVPPSAEPAAREPHFCTLGSGRFSRWMTMWAW